MNDYLLALLTSAVGTLAAALVATTFEVLPDRVDLLGFVLQSAGLSSIVGLALGTLRERQERRQRRAGHKFADRYAALGTLIGTLLGLVGFLLLLLIQGIS